MSRETVPVLLESDFLLKSLKCSYLQKGPDSFAGVSIYSRNPQRNKLFFALQGARFDGHDFLEEAVRQGATGLLVSDRGKAEKLLGRKTLTVIAVPDTLKALQDLARAWIRHLKTKVVAVTGSNGKTTTRAFAQTLFFNKKAFASPQSYNGLFGLPLSLLYVNRKEAFLIQEIGTSQPGEIAWLTSLCDPIVSAVTMIGPSHLEGLKSLESVAQEKRDIYLKSPSALWIFNRGNPWTEKMFQEIGPSHSSKLTFSSHHKTADVSLRFLEEGLFSSVIEGRIGSVHSQSKALFAGKPNLDNLMCACAMALGAGLDPKEIWSLIPDCRLPKGRQELFQIKDKKISILFDAYNANPSSMDFFLKSCSARSKPGQRLFVIGDMRELGKDSEIYHKKLAGNPVLLSARFVGFVGEHGALFEEELKSRGFKGRFIRSKAYNKELFLALSEELKAGDFVAIKASRSLKLERLLFDLTGQKSYF